MEWARSQEEKNRIPSDRIDYLDAAKGISILLIVCLHHLNGSDLAKKIFCSISIVPFILISGFLYLELSSQLQHHAKENLIGRFPTEAFARTSIQFSSEGRKMAFIKGF